LYIREQFTHYGEMYKGVDMRGEVGLLTRNIKFDSEEAESSDTYGGHIKVQTCIYNIY
jgi:cell migration-inducing and hyaluronan-binding protein